MERSSYNDNKFGPRPEPPIGIIIHIPTKLSHQLTTSRRQLRQRLSIARPWSWLLMDAIRGDFFHVHGSVSQNQRNTTPHLAFIDNSHPHTSGRMRDEQ